MSHEPSPSTNVTSEPRVGRKQLCGAATLGHATTAVRADLGGDAARPRRSRPRGASGRCRRRRRPRRACAFARADVDRVDDLVVDVEAGDVGEEDEPLRAEAERERRRRVVGVHVQRADGERCDDRDLAVRRARRAIALRAARQRVADPAERRHRHGEQAVAVAEDRDRELADRGAELGVDRGHRLAHDVERCARRAAAAVRRTRRGCRGGSSPR